jgi:hypothetical protein
MPKPILIGPEQCDGIPSMSNDRPRARRGVRRQPAGPELERLRSIYRRRLLTCVTTLIGVVPLVIVIQLLFGPEIEQPGAITVADAMTLALALAAAGFASWTWRCPECNRLWIIDLYPRACRYCHVRFRG